MHTPMSMRHALGWWWKSNRERCANSVRMCASVCCVSVCVKLVSVTSHTCAWYGGYYFCFHAINSYKVGWWDCGCECGVCVCLVAVRLSVSWRPITEQRAYGTYRNATNKMLNTLKISTSNFVTLWCIKKNTAVPDLLKLCEFTTNGRTLKTL